jgi:uncharacterized protein (DUF433 family)
MFTPSQAAVITGLSLKSAQKAIDNRPVPATTARQAKTTRRLLSEEALVCLHLEAGGLSVFPAATRKRLFAEILRNPEKRSGQPAPIVTVDLRPSRQAMAKAVRQLKKSESLVIENPEVLSGAPVFKGTRVPVHQIALELEQGSTVEEVLQAYPTVSREQAEAAAIYARANPRTGRPPVQPWRGSRPVKVMRYVVSGLRAGARKRAS